MSSSLAKENGDCWIDCEEYFKSLGMVRKKQDDISQGNYSILLDKMQQDCKIRDFTSNFGQHFMVSALDLTKRNYLEESGESSNSREPIMSTPTEKLNEDADISEGEQNDCMKENRSEDYKILITTLEERLQQLDLKIDKKILCPYRSCGTSIMISSLPSHMRFRHELNLGKVTCPLCRTKVKTIAIHMERCSSGGVKKFPCTVTGCKAMFVTKNNLGSHLYQKHVPPIKCPYKDCEKYLRRKCLKLHIASVHGDKKFYSDLVLQNNIEKSASNGVKRFFCDVKGCEASYVYKKAWHAHRQEHIQSIASRHSETSQPQTSHEMIL